MNIFKFSRIVGVLSCFNLGVYAQLSPPSKESAPNPIADTYPSGTTGTFNSTIFVIPISIELARSLIPQQWSINKKAYTEPYILTSSLHSTSVFIRNSILTGIQVLPGFPEDSYPLVVRSGVDHDVGIKSLHASIDDFQTFHTFFPFVDIFNDGYSSFSYQKYLVITSTNLIGIASLPGYGTLPVPATFSPNMEAYGNCDDTAKLGDGYFKAYGVLNQPGIPTAAIDFESIGSVTPWHMNFYVNVTNQPQTSNGILCDNQIFFYNSTISTGANAPIGVKGSVTLNTPLLPKDTTFNDVFGVRVDTAFLEIASIPCSNLKGYHGTGPGDRGTGT